MRGSEVEELYEFFPPDNMEVQLVRKQYILAALKDISAPRKVNFRFLMPHQQLILQFAKELGLC